MRWRNVAGFNFMQTQCGYQHGSGPLGVRLFRHLVTSGGVVNSMGCYIPLIVSPARSTPAKGGDAVWNP
jgi:hypothetical protein